MIPWIFTALLVLCPPCEVHVGLYVRPPPPRFAVRPWAWGADREYLHLFTETEQGDFFGLYCREVAPYCEYVEIPKGTLQGEWAEIKVEEMTP